MYPVVVFTYLLPTVHLMYTRRYTSSYTAVSPVG